MGAGRSNRGGGQRGRNNRSGGHSCRRCSVGRDSGNTTRGNGGRSNSRGGDCCRDGGCSSNSGGLDGICSVCRRGCAGRRRGTSPRGRKICGRCGDREVPFASPRYGAAAARTGMAVAGRMGAAVVAGSGRRTLNPKS